MRYPFVEPELSHARGIPMPILPLSLAFGDRFLKASGLVDTGSAVNVLPYSAGVRLGLIWDEQNVNVALTGIFSQVPAKGVLVSATIVPFDVVDLAFAWSRSEDVPLILGQMNFFEQFDACFFRSAGEFEIWPKNST